MQLGEKKKHETIMTDACAKRKTSSSNPSRVTSDMFLQVFWGLTMPLAIKLHTWPAGSTRLESTTVILIPRAAHWPTYASGREEGQALKGSQVRAQCQTLTRGTLISWISNCRYCSEEFTFCDLLPPTVGFEVSAWFSLWVLGGDGVNFWAARRGLVLVAMVVLRRT